MAVFSGEAGRVTPFTKELAVFFWQGLAEEPFGVKAGFCQLVFLI